MFDAARSCGADWALLTRPESVTYSTGLAAPVELSQPLFSGGPVTALVGRDGRCGVVLTARHLEDVSEPPSIESVITYPGSSIHDPSELATNYLRALRQLWLRMEASGRVAVEARYLPWAAAQTLVPLATGMVEFDAALDEVRTIKTAGELDLLHRCSRVAQIGQAAARSAARPGVTELELFLESRAAMERTAGTRLVVTADVLSGLERTARGGGGPSDRRLRRGDPVLIDLAPRVQGYWGDSCTSFITDGSPSGPWKRLHRAALVGLLEGLSMIRAGVAIERLDSRVRAAVRREGGVYNHHTGHGIGVAHHDLPRVVPEAPGKLREGMVLTLEPGAYDPDVGGVRLEATVAVVADGCDILAAPVEALSA